MVRQHKKGRSFEAFVGSGWRKARTEDQRDYARARQRSLSMSRRYPEDTRDPEYVRVMREERERASAKAVSRHARRKTRTRRSR